MGTIKGLGSLTSLLLVGESERESCSVMSNSLGPHGYPWNSPGQNTGVSNCSLLQGIFPIQGSNPGLPTLQAASFQLSLQGSPRIMEWVAYPFARGNLPDPGIELSSPALWADSLPAELQGKPFGGRETKNLELKCPVYIVVLRIIQTG